MAAVGIKSTYYTTAIAKFEMRAFFTEHGVKLPGTLEPVLGFAVSLCQPDVYGMLPSNSDVSSWQEKDWQHKEHSRVHVLHFDRRIINLLYCWPNHTCRFLEHVIRHKFLKSSAVKWRSVNRYCVLQTVKSAQLTDYCVHFGVIDWPNHE